MALQQFSRRSLAKTLHNGNALVTDREPAEKLPYSRTPMKETLCDISAFRLYRTPPQLLAQFPMLPSPETDKTRSGLKSHPITRHITGPVTHLLVTERRRRSSAKCIRSHLASTEIPFGCLRTSNLGANITSPLFTLLQLAQHLPEEELIMAMYEFCGSFTVFKPSPEIEALLANPQETVPDPWKRVVGKNGTATNLWQRKPLIAIEELRAFAATTKGMRGNRRFARAALNVSGVTASPFEAQTSILLTRSRRKGGEGFPHFTNNERVALNPKARILSNRFTCYADILFKGSRLGKPLIIECQGRIVHDDADSAVSDGNRVVALQHMGYEVMLLSYEQIAQPDRFEVVKRLIARYLGIKYRRKTKGLQHLEHELRRKIFIDWSTIAA